VQIPFTLYAETNENVYMDLDILRLGWLRKVKSEEMFTPE
jgi:hypothetical protein